ncbi:MAG TPA: hypothetical protein VJ865_11080 [Gemmatimonadaceae bacterium]|nr:hypothetical protein [Gemmatimonadaceae bacterium]
MSRSAMLSQFALVLITAALTACGAGPKPVQTVQAVRAVPPQPLRDASGNILTVPVTIPDGTEFTAQTLSFLSSETANIGDEVQMEVDSDVIVDGAIAIAAGSPVRGTVANVTRASRMGRSGSISVHVESTRAVDEQRVPVRATKGRTEGDKAGSTIALAVVVSPLFLLRRGNDVAYQPGTKIPVYIDGKLNVQAWRR